MNIDEVSSKRLSMSAMMSADPVGQPAKADNVGRAFLAFALTLANSQSLGMGPLALPDRVILLPVQVQALVRQQQRDGPRWVLVYLGLRCLWKGCGGNRRSRGVHVRCCVVAGACRLDTMNTCQNDRGAPK